MRYALSSLVLLTLFACGPAGDGSKSTAQEWKSFPVLEGADADSAVKIASIEALCKKIDKGNAHSMTVMAYKGQRLDWLATVESIQGQRLVAGAATLRLSLAVGDPEEYEPGEEVEIEGIVASLDPATRMITLQPEATVTAVGE